MSDPTPGLDIQLTAVGPSAPMDLAQAPPQHQYRDNEQPILPLKRKAGRPKGTSSTIEQRARKKGMEGKVRRGEVLFHRPSTSELLEPLPVNTTGFVTDNATGRFNLPIDDDMDSTDGAATIAGMPIGILERVVGSSLKRAGYREAERRKRIALQYGGKANLLTNQLLKDLEKDRQQAEAISEADAKELMEVIIREMKSEPGKSVEELME